MTDKVQKIREEVERLKSQLLRGACSSQIAMETMCKEEAYNEVLSILDTMQEEPVSEDLKEAAQKYADLRMSNYGIAFYAFMSGAKWQKEQFEKDCADLCNGIATAKGFAVAMAYDKGMADAKEQMMAKAIDVEVKVDAGGYPYIPQMELYDYDKDIPLAKEGDKYKVVLIKDD